MVVSMSAGFVYLALRLIVAWGRGLTRFQNVIYWLDKRLENLNPRKAPIQDAHEWERGTAHNAFSTPQVHVTRQFDI